MNIPGQNDVPPGRMLDGKLVEYVVAVRLALQALQFVAGDPELSERFRRDVLNPGDTIPPDVAVLMTPELLKDSVGLFAEAMLLEGYS